MASTYFELAHRPCLSKSAASSTQGGPDWPMEHEEISDTEHVLEDWEEDRDALADAYTNHPLMKAEVPEKKMGAKPGMAKPVPSVALQMGVPCRPAPTPSHKKGPTAFKSMARPQAKQAMAPMPKDSRDELIEKLQVLDSSCLKDFLALCLRDVCGLTEIVLQKLSYFVVDCLKGVS